MNTLALSMILGVPILSMILAASRMTDDNKRFWFSIFATFVITAFTVFVHKNTAGKPLPSFDLSHGQTYEMLNRFDHEGASIVYLTPINIHPDSTYSRDGRGLRCYYVDGSVPTNRIVVASTEGKWGYLLPVDHGTNEFHLSQ